MSRTLFALALLAALGSAPAPAGPGPLGRRPKVDDVKARALIETLRSDPDDKRRKAAADELGGADPRQSPDVVPALVRALRKDSSASVRAEAADSLRDLGDTFPLAAVALQEAVDSDPAPAVRLAARRTLWEYHLNGYRPPKGGDTLAYQTIEPPVASPAGPRVAVALVPAPPAPAAPPRVPAMSNPAPTLPQVSPQAPAVQSTSQYGPRKFLPNVLPGPRAAVRERLDAGSGPPPLANLTAEPPISAPYDPQVAKPRPRIDGGAVKPLGPTVPVPPNPYPPTPPTAPEPPFQLPLDPPYTPTLPPFVPDLPPVVTPPDRE